MNVVQTIAAFREERTRFGRVALVPTMGALHEGHLSLMRYAKQHAPHVVVSIFVNPTQFGPREDYTKYPRPIDEDLKKCEAEGVELVFNPPEQEIYHADSAQILIDMPQLSEALEGKHRPGHFKGVCQVVAKLFNIIQPQVALFGNKDFQQLRIITAMAEALDWPIEIIGCPTVREKDGLAMSSRNQYLSADERERGLAISRALMLAQAEARSGVTQANRLVATMRNVLLDPGNLGRIPVAIDYVAAVDPTTLKPVDVITGPTLLAIAARVGNTRLIDNIVVALPSPLRPAYTFIIMMQVLFRIPFINLPIYSYGLMMVIGFLCAISLAKYLAKRNGLDPELFVNAGLIALLTGIGGSRLSHVLENLSQYTSPNRSFAANLFDAINIRSGGLTYYGGFLLAFPSLVGYAIVKKIPLRLGMDIVAPCIVIGLGFGRIGCFLNGCCYGDHCDLPWAVTFPNPQIGGPLHPTQLYSSFTAFLIGAIAIAYQTLPHATGRAFALMLILEGCSRFILELLRVEPAVIGNFSLSMIIGIAVAALGALLWSIFGTGQSPAPRPIAAPA